MKILMVCLGNICRSPLAEGIMKNLVQKEGLDWQVDSSGTGGWHVGKLPDERSIKVAANHGLDITDQGARQLKPHDLVNYDLILAMDSSNYNDIMKFAETDKQKEKVKLIMNYDMPGRNESVPDPYWGNDGFELVYDMLLRACTKVLAAHR